MIVAEQARASAPTTSTCCTATRRSPRSGSTPTARARCRSAASPSPWRATRSSTRPSRSPPTSSRRAPTTSSSPAGRSRVKGSPDKSMPLAAIAFEAFTAHNLPDGLEPNLEAQVTYDPPNFSWPFGTHMCVVEVDTETGGVDVLEVRRRRRLRRAGQPADRRRPGARRRHPGPRPGAVRGGRLRHRRQPARRRRWPSTSCRRPATCRRSRSATPSRRRRPTSSASRASARPARSAPRRP